ncbi:MAG: Bax inhibitor-1/YccA family protein [bacterium]
MQTDNPVLREGYFDRAAGDSMAIEGVINRCFIMLIMLVAAAVPAWQATGARGAIIIGGALIGLGLALATIFMPDYAYVTAPLYAIAEGAFLGAFTAVLEAQYPGIAIQALLLTTGVFFVMLTLYRSGTIVVTDRLRSGIVAATGAILLVYVISFVGRLFLGASIPFIHEGGPLGIVFSLVVVGVAAFNLLLDFDFIERMAEKNADKKYEWMGAFGLIVTLVWLYIEILILLSKLRR